MASTKIPVSLKFDDSSDFYNDFIKPLRETHGLSSFIVDILYAYYADANVHSMVDSYISSANGVNKMKQHMEAVAQELSATSNGTILQTILEHIKGLESRLAEGDVGGNVQAQSQNENSENGAKMARGGVEGSGGIVSSVGGKNGAMGLSGRNMGGSAVVGSSVKDSMMSIGSVGGGGSAFVAGIDADVDDDDDIIADVVGDEEDNEEDDALRHLSDREKELASALFDSM